MWLTTNAISENDMPRNRACDRAREHPHRGGEMPSSVSEARFELRFRSRVSSARAAHSRVTTRSIETLNEFADLDWHAFDDTIARATGDLPAEVRDATP